jgi:catechol 2,3-dioxygenase-like lactoylglutathione lyase family enzyme
MRGLYLFIGGILVGLAVQMAIAQNQNRNVVGLNHVAISVTDIDEAVAYYTDIMGFPEAFRRVNDAGQITLLYVQISEDTFIELQPANDQRPPGINHFGVQVENMAMANAMFKERGATISEPRAGSTMAILSNITDLNGIRIELGELPPESLQRQAIERWQ